MSVEIKGFEYPDRLKVIVAWDKLKSLMGIICAGSMDTDPVISFQDKFFKKIWLPKWYNLVVDLEYVNFISSSGLGFLLMLEEAKKDIVLITGLNENIKDSMNFLGVESYFKTFNSLGEINEIRIPQNFVNQLIDVKKTLETTKEARLSTLRTKVTKILADYVGMANVVGEMANLHGYFNLARTKNELTLPAEYKYSAVVYELLHRILLIEMGFKDLTENQLEFVAR